MNSKASQGALIFIAFIVLVGAIGGILLSAYYNQRFITGGEIKMVQPNGVLPALDSHYAERVNVPNSQANLNNGQSRVYNAQATAIVVDALNEQGRTYVQGAGTGFWLGCLCVFVFIVPIFLLITRRQVEVS